MNELTEVLTEKPRYDGESIVNLMASLLGATGGRSTYPGLTGLDSKDLEQARRLVLIVVDGLGYEFLSTVRDAKTLRGRLARRLTSVFPPTTASAVTTFLTGLAPQQHALTGWFMYMRELERVITVLPFTSREDGKPLSRLGVEPGPLFGHTAVFELMNRDCHVIVPRSIAYSQFNTAHAGHAAIHAYDGLDKFFAEIERALWASDKSFLYAYWPELDHLAHLHGIASPQAHSHAEYFDERYGAFLERIAGSETLVLLTADHGFVDVAPGAMIDMADHPALREMLRAPLCGEPRTAYCYVAQGRAADFERYVQSNFAEQIVCAPSRALIDAGYFGLGVPHPELASRVGDYTLCLRPGYAVLDRQPGERRFMPIGVHGGGSTQELGVPLVVAAV
jgi:Type I phosphodiesterase / nucleotide pyrophosphatase